MTEITIYTTSQQQHQALALVNPSKYPTKEGEKEEEKEKEKEKEKEGDDDLLIPQDAKKAEFEAKVLVRKAKAAVHAGGRVSLAISSLERAQIVCFSSSSSSSSLIMTNKYFSGFFFILHEGLS